MTLWDLSRGVLVTARKDIMIYYRKAPVFIFGVILPTFLFFAFFVGRHLEVRAYFPGFLAMSLFFTSSSVGPIIVPWEKQTGTFERLLSLPLTISMLVLGDTLAAALFGLVISIGVFAFGAAFLNLSIPVAYVWAVPVLFALGNLCFASFGVFLSSPAGRTPSNVMMLSSLVRFPLIFISGIFVPLSGASAMTRLVTQLSPLTYLVDGLNKSMGLSSVNGILVDVIVLISFTIVFLVAASTILRRLAFKGL